MEYEHGTETVIVMTEVYYNEYGDPVFYASTGDGVPAPAILHVSHEDDLHWRRVAIEELMDTIDKFKEAMKKPILRKIDFKKVP